MYNKPTSWLVCAMTVKLLLGSLAGDKWKGEALASHTI